jgi:hypothetical protein
MKTFTTEELAELIARHRFGAAAAAINDRYRQLSERILDVFDDFICTLAGTSIVSDFQNLMALLHVGGPSRRRDLREFVGSRKVQNCLTAVLLSIEKSVPTDVKMGFRKPSDFFRESEFFSTYSADIVNYEPEFSRLTDQRLIRLLSAPPNTIDLDLLDDDALRKKQLVLDAYGAESLDPVRDIFIEALSKCEDFFQLLEEHAESFRTFFDDFREKKFRPDDGIVAEWLSLGDEYFHLELNKSSLMLPISPKALYWGMQRDYPDTLLHLGELKSMVTPHIEIGDPERMEDEWVIGIECLNPSSLKKESLTIHPSLKLATADLTTAASFSYRVIPLEGQRKYLFRFRGELIDGTPLPVTLRVTCNGRCYAAEFTKEKTIDLSPPGG